MSAPEFSRRIALDRIGAPLLVETIAASPDERAALARRFGWLTLDALTAETVLTAQAAAIDAKGRLRARLSQPCVVTGDPVPATIDQDFHIRFAAAEPIGEGAGEIELSSDDLDLMEHDGTAIDLGEGVAQTLALSVDPFPRSAGADQQIKDAGVLGDGETGPFAGLKGLLGR